MTNSALKPHYSKRHQNFDRLLMDEFFRPSFRNGHQDVEKTTPAYANIAKKENDFLIQIAVPGFAKEDIQLLMDGHMLTVKGNKAPTKAQYIKREFNFNNFERVFTLPKTGDLNKIEASVSNGILSININSLVEKPQLQIQVK